MPALFGSITFTLKVDKHKLGVLTFSFEGYNAFTTFEQCNRLGLADG